MRNLESGKQNGGGNVQEMSTSTYVPNPSSPNSSERHKIPALYSLDIAHHEKRVNAKDRLSAASQRSEKSCKHHQTDNMNILHTPGGERNGELKRTKKFYLANNTCGRLLLPVLGGGAKDKSTSLRALAKMENQMTWRT